LAAALTLIIALAYATKLVINLASYDFLALWDDLPDFLAYTAQLIIKIISKIY